MKKTGFRILTLLLALFMCATCTFAVGHPMSKPEHAAFIAEMSSTIKKLADQKAPAFRSSKDAGIKKFIKELESGNDTFDSKSMRARSTAADYMAACHKLVSSPKEFYKKGPLCCRGLSSYVAKCSADKGIAFNYIQFICWANSKCPNPELLSNEARGRLKSYHVAVKYNIEDREYICDFLKSFESYVVENYGSPSLKSELRVIDGGHRWQEFLSMPIDEYQRLFKYDGALSRRDPADGLFHLDEAWSEREIDPAWSYHELIDHPSKILDYIPKTSYEDFEHIVYLLNGLQNGEDIHELARSKGISAEDKLRYVDIIVALQTGKPVDELLAEKTEDSSTKTAAESPSDASTDDLSKDLAKLDLGKAND